MVDLSMTIETSRALVSRSEKMGGSRWGASVITPIVWRRCPKRGSVYVRLKIDLMLSRFQAIAAMIAMNGSR